MQQALTPPRMRHLHQGIVQEINQQSTHSTFINHTPCTVHTPWDDFKHTLQCQPLDLLPHHTMPAPISPRPLHSFPLQLALRLDTADLYTAYHGKLGHILDAKYAGKGAAK